MESTLKPVNLNKKLVQSLLPKRPPTAHKGHFGTVGVIAGSANYPGAAVLCVLGALRTGAGLVRLASTKTVCAAVAAAAPCCTFLPQPATKNAGISPGCVQALLNTKPSAVLCGSGLGKSPQSAAIVQSLLSLANCALVLDADALNLISGHLDSGFCEKSRQELMPLLAKSNAPLVICPHIGEMARLCGTGNGQVQKNQMEFAARFAAKHNCVVVLKSHQTAIAAKDGKMFFNIGAQNPGLAKGGSGDVLAGVIASLLGQGLDAANAAAAGVWLCSAAAKAGVKKLGFAGFLPQDLPLYLAKTQRDMGF